MFAGDRIGLVGHGFVGKALYEGMKHVLFVKVYDKFCPLSPEEGGVNSLADLAKLAEVIFVCVPTPMRPDGSCDVSIVTSVVKEIESYGQGNVVVIKSTVPPGTTEKLHHERNSLTGVVFNPEFLTEKNYIDDFKNQTRIILGSSDYTAAAIVKRVYQRAFPDVPIIKIEPTVAEMIKYTTNTFLATKISFANEIKQICDILGVDYDEMIKYALYDSRLGNSYWSVPGHDGHYGFGLSCLPKDLNALIARASELGVDAKVMTAVWQKNLEVRCNRDWEMMAKAVTNPKQDSSKE